MKLSNLSSALLLALLTSCATANHQPPVAKVTNQAGPLDPVAVAKGAPVTRLSAIAAGMEWIGKAVDDPEYYVWCTSPIMGPDKKVHLFCSRWPKKYGMGGWSSHSEIAHYVGDLPEGPFKLADIAIAANPGAVWNNTIHNPSINQVGGEYVLLYITQDAHHPDDWRTCMATADSLSGPWVKQGKDGLMFEPSKDPKHWTHDAHALANPTFLAHKGKYYIYFNCGYPWDRTKFPIPSRYGYAVAEKLEGPYQLSDAPCTDNIDYIEDATAFVWNGKFCLLLNDNMGSHTGVPGRGILWRSDTPTDFRLANAEIGFLKTSDYCKHVDLSKARRLYGSEFKFERPGILMIKGKPAYFYGPSGFNLEGADHTCSYVMKINLAK